MIVIAGHLTIDPAKRDEALAAMRECIEATRAEEGNVAYLFSEDVTEPNRINITEIWQDNDALTAHFSTPHLTGFMAAVPGFAAGSSELVRYDVSGTTKLL